MSKIAIINIGMHGHVNPTLGFTEELVKRGHEVTYFCASEFSQQISKTGALFAEYGTQTGKVAHQFAKQQMQGDQSALKSAAHDFYLTELQQTLPILLEKLEALSPDVVIYDFVSLSGRLATHRLGIPSVKFFTTYAGNKAYSPLKKAFSRSVQMTAEQRLSLQKSFDEITAHYGCESCDPDSVFEHQETDHFIFMPRSFHMQSEAFDDSYHFVGPCLRSQDASSAAEFLPEGEDPLVLISLGTMFHEWVDFYRACITVFRDLPCRVAMSIGPNIDPKELGEIPKNFVVKPHLPQVALLNKASLFVSHGGMNSTMESLHMGVPMVVIPQMEEQEMSARRVEELELGAFIKKEEFSVDTLKAAFEFASSPKVRENVARMQADVRNAGGSVRAACIIEELAKSQECAPPAPQRTAQAGRALEQL